MPMSYPTRAINFCQESRILLSIWTNAHLNIDLINLTGNMYACIYL